MDAGERAIADGADAVYIDTVGDYGIARLRAASPVPVVGASRLGAVGALVHSQVEGSTVDFIADDCDVCAVLPAAGRSA